MFRSIGCGECCQNVFGKKFGAVITNWERLRLVSCSPCNVRCKSRPRPFKNLPPIAKGLSGFILSSEPIKSNKNFWVDLFYTPLTATDLSPRSVPCICNCDIARVYVTCLKRKVLMAKNSISI